MTEAMVASDTGSITPEDSTQDQLNSFDQNQNDPISEQPNNNHVAGSQHVDDSYSDEASNTEDALQDNDAASSMWSNSDGEETMQQEQVSTTQPASKPKADSSSQEQVMQSGDTDALLASSSEQCIAEPGHTCSQSRRASAANNNTEINTSQMAENSVAFSASSNEAKGSRDQKCPPAADINNRSAREESYNDVVEGDEDSYSRDDETAAGEISFQNDQQQRFQSPEEGTQCGAKPQSGDDNQSNVVCLAQQESKDPTETQQYDEDCRIVEVSNAYYNDNSPGELDQSQAETLVVVDDWDEENELVLRISTQPTDVTTPNQNNYNARPQSANPNNRLHSISAQRSNSRPGSATCPESPWRDSNYSPVSSPHGGNADCQQWSEDGYNVNQGAMDMPHPATWCTRDVADWITSIGMDQYRKRFMHNCVDGRLLLSLTDQLLKTELGIGPLGHRAAILHAIQELASVPSNRSPGTFQSYSRPQSACTQRSPLHGSRSRPCSAPRLRGMQGGQPGSLSRPASAVTPGVLPPDSYLGPASGKVTVYEQHSKLKYELDRAAARAAQQRAVAQQLSRTASLSAEEVARLRGLLSDLEKKNGMLVAGGSAGGIDSEGRVPWRPSSAQTAISAKACTEVVTCGGCMTLSAQPRMTHRSKQLLAQTQSQGAACATFLDRLEMDNRRRERARVEADNKYYSPEALHKDPLLARKKQQRDLKFVTDCLKDKGLITVNLVARDTECDGILTKDVTDQCKDIWGIPDAELDMIQAAHGVRRVTLLAAALRTQLFMARYDSEQSDRLSGVKQRELQTKYWETVMGKPKETKAAQDMSQCVKHFAQLGWSTEDDITDDRLSALLRRVTAYKQAHEKWRDQQAAGQAGGGPVVDFSMPPFSTDGLATLQAAAPQTPVTDIKGVPKPGGMDALTYTVQLLAKCRRDDIDKMEALSGTAKQLAVYRHIRTQKFIEFTEAEIKSKHDKLNQAYAAMSKPKRVISKPELEGFLDRLMDDAAKRRVTREKMAAEKLEKEAANIKSVAMYKTRPRSAR